MVIGTVARLDNVTQYFGAQLVFEKLAWEIYHDARIGLVGPNGAGKSTILKMLAGKDAPERGGVFITRGVRVGYLPQEPEFDLTRTVIAEALDASPTLAALERELERLNAQMADPVVYNDERKLQRVLDQHARAVAAFEEKGGLNFDNRVRATLRGLGFRDADFDLPMSALSGGQKKLVGLAKLLIEQPELLLLDEPDNHLDLNGKTFLEKLIADYPGAVVIVSHDRYLLDIVAEEIVELEDGALTHYVGNYSEYAFEKKQRLLKQQQMYEIQQHEIDRLRFSIRRLMSWNAGQSEKFVRRARSMQKRLDKMDKLDKPRLQRKTIGVALAAQRRGSNKVLEINALEKSFDGPSAGSGQAQVLRGLDLMVWHHERVGMIGPNGAGKTVLFRCILGSETPERGEIKIGPSTTMAYYAQEHQTLDYDATLAEEVRGVKAMIDRELYGLLGRFLFTPEDAQKKISQLSGGEKARVQIAKLMMRGANFLLLDEPTNNLDIRSSEILEAALDGYDGTVLVISHDRYFLDNVVDRIVELDDGVMTEYLGNYTYYVEEKARRARGEPAYVSEDTEEEEYEMRTRAKKNARGK
ncbi:MAG: ABC-F family ATP-binding cassette domain-containing protein [Chloroflexi bacterium]|nr:ABC-F family ATP-binding cassette domain-containing protein [Chloroflexota bacterium]